MEATSFVHPKWVPQLADAAELMAMLIEGLGERGRQFPVLVPNERGLDRALEIGCEHIAIFGSATETFAQRNLNRSLDEQFAMFEPTVTRARDAGHGRPGLRRACASATPGRATSRSTRWSGSASGSSTSAPASSASATRSVSGLPGTSPTSSTRSTPPGLADDVLAVHFHDTYGQALANAHAALRHGITTFDASAGGLGGCPYAESATGNLATEDLVWMLHGLGIETGVDLDALVATSVWMAGVLGRPSPSRVVNALA